MTPFSLNTYALIGACLIGALSSYLAYRRGKNPYLWFFIGFLFGIFGIMAIFFAPSKKKIPTLPPELKDEPILTISGPKDKFWYYLDSAHQKQGPMSYNALTFQWKEGKVDLSTFVWNEELVDWKPLQELVKG
ncbi:MAG: DUF4339 domain-containing protein [Chlamydiota bacterium]